MSDLLPDALEEALARIIAAERKQWIKEREHIEAEYRALVAELRAEVLSLRVALKEQADAEIARLREALAQVRDGRDGADGAPGEKGAQGDPGPAGEPGKDAEPEAVAEIVLARMPAPEPGPAGKDADPDEVAEKAAAIVLERMPLPIDGRDGRDGADGKDADPEAIDALVSEKVAAAVAAVPLPEKGEKGDPGEDVDMDTVAVMVEEATRRSVAELPSPKDGKDADPELMRQMISEEVAKLPPAEPGRDGKDAEVDYGLIVDTVCEKVIAVLPPPEKGEPGRDGNDAEVDYSIVKTFVTEEVRQRVAELPPPEKGEKGDKGERGDPGERGMPGRDGADIVELLTDSEDMLVATLSDGRVKVCGGPVRGTKGEPGVPGRDGKDGQDGLSFQSFQFDVEHDGERKWILKWLDAAGKLITREFSVPALIYRDIYREGRSYERGDAVTFGGCVWIALRDTSEKPGNGCKDWRMSVKAGGPGASSYSIARDLGFRGSQAEWIESLKGERGPEGRPGRDFVLRG